MKISGLTSAAPGPDEIKCSFPCNICGSDDIDVLSLMDRDRKYLRTVICRECGLIWSDPKPDVEKVRSYYENDYRIEYKGNYQPALKHVYRAGRKALFRYSFIRPYLRKPLAVLDAGSGSGEFVYLLHKLGFDACGIEPNQGYGAYARREYGLEVNIGFIEDVDFGDVKFDLITIYHVLEHTEDPFKVMIKLRNILTPGGILVVEVPNIEAECQAPKNRFHQPHLYHFNKATLSMLGRKAGLNLLDLFFAADGANIYAIFSNLGNDNGQSLKIGGNYEHIAGILTRHTSYAHYTTACPYTRLLGKIMNFIDEKKAIRGFSGGREMLDYYFTLWLGRSGQTGNGR